MYYFLIIIAINDQGIPNQEIKSKTFLADFKLPNPFSMQA